MRLDIGWLDLACGWISSLWARDSQAMANRVETRWSPDGDSLACLSVRSSLDLLLRALKLPPGSEVLYSAVTIPDMVQVARENGLQPVPVDLTGADLHIDLDALTRAISPRSRVLVVAHLFGGRPDLSPVLERAHGAGLFVVEDCAQAWCGPEYRGDPRADASLFSFGTIKTMTALGGALARVGDRSLREQMLSLQSAQPVESQSAFRAKFLNTTMLKAISTRPVFTPLTWLGRLRGLTVEQLLNKMTQGFPGNDLMQQLRRQPCAALLQLLDRRIRNYDERPVRNRIAHAQFLRQQGSLDESMAELGDSNHTFWLFPYQSAAPQQLVERLAEAGIDSTRYGRLEVVPAPQDRPELDCSSARSILDRIVFLPCYPAMSQRAMQRICQVLGKDTA